MPLIRYVAMLVVTRKVGERIVIGDQVTVTVVRIAGGVVRIGVDAPAEFTVVRRELLDAQAAERLGLADTQPDAKPSQGPRS